MDKGSISPESCGFLGNGWLLEKIRISGGRWVTVRASLVAQIVKNLPAMQDKGVQFLGWEDPLEKEMATHSSILAWKIP